MPVSRIRRLRQLRRGLAFLDSILEILSSLCLGIRIYPVLLADEAGCELDSGAKVGHFEGKGDELREHGSSHHCRRLPLRSVEIRPVEERSLHSLKMP